MDTIKYTTESFKVSHWSHVKNTDNIAKQNDEFICTMTVYKK